MDGMQHTERVETVVTGGGQAGLSVGYHLARRGLPFVILDAGKRTGDSWRNRWDSLRLFTINRYAGVDGMRISGPRYAYATKARSPTTSRITRRTSSSPSEGAFEWTGCPVTIAVSQ